MTEEHLNNWQGLVEGCDCDGCREYRAYNQEAGAEREIVHLTKSWLKHKHLFTNEDEYTCLKCGSGCVIEWDESKCAGGWPSCWCDTCEDEAKGFGPAAANADRLADMTDRAMDNRQAMGWLNACDKIPLQPIIKPLKPAKLVIDAAGKEILKKRGLA